MQCLYMEHLHMLFCNDVHKLEISVKRNLECKYFITKKNLKNAKKSLYKFYQIRKVSLILTIPS